VVRQRTPAHGAGYLFTVPGGAGVSRVRGEDISTGWGVGCFDPTGSASVAKLAGCRVKRSTRKAMLDTEKHNAQYQGAMIMRQQIVDQFAQFATTHPDPVVAHELWEFVDKIRAMKVNL